MFFFAFASIALLRAKPPGRSCAPAYGEAFDGYARLATADSFPAVRPRFRDAVGSVLYMLDRALPTYDEWAARIVHGGGSDT